MIFKQFHIYWGLFTNSFANSVNFASDFLSTTASSAFSSLPLFSDGMTTDIIKLVALWKINQFWTWFMRYFHMNQLQSQLNRINEVYLWTKFLIFSTPNLSTNAANFSFFPVTFRRTEWNLNLNKKRIYKRIDSLPAIWLWFFVYLCVPICVRWYIPSTSDGSNWISTFDFIPSLHHTMPHTMEFFDYFVHHIYWTVKCILRRECKNVINFLFQ